MAQTRNAVLATLVQQDLVKLMQWTSHVVGRLRTRLAFDVFGGNGLHWSVPNGDTWYQARHSIGGPERIAVMLQRIEIDVDADGVITEQEYKTTEKAQTRVVDACLAQLLNVGIVSGLTLTVFYPMAMTKLEASEDSVEYFGRRSTDVFAYVYYVFMYYCVVESVVLVFKSARAYLHLSMWMSSLEMKIWYLDRLDMSAYVRSCFNIIKSVVWSVPMGVAVTVSPLAGCLALGAFLYFYTRCLAFSKCELETLWFMWQYTSYKMDMRLGGVNAV